MKNYDEFIYSKHITYRDNLSRVFCWYLINKKTRCGVHFHGVQYPEEYECKAFCPWEDWETGKNRYRFAAHGLEVHSTTPIYKEQTPMENCFVTQGDCYHDGTSLYASRMLGHINPEEDDKIIWNVLHSFYEDNLGGRNERD